MTEEHEKELLFESPEKEGRLLLELIGVPITSEIEAMLANSSSPVQLAFSIRQLYQAKELNQIKDLSTYQRWLEVDGSLFLELVKLNKYQVLATLEVDLIGDNVRDYAIFRAVSEIIKSNLADEINKHQQIINHPRFDYVNFANAIEALSRRG